MAVKKLGWVSVDVMMVNPKDKLEQLEIEIDENMARKSFSYDEIDSAYAQKEKMSAPPFVVAFLLKILKMIMSLFVKNKK